MEENVNARIVLGGKIVNFKGRMAGIFEEAICAIQKKHPIYLLGGFGGASAQIVKLMKGETTAEKLFEEAKTNEDYKKLIEYCQMSCLPTINYDELRIIRFLEMDLIKMKMKFYSTLLIFPR